jgi:hypothetical protein
VTRTLVTVLCCVSGTGTIGATADCPSCGRPDRDRVTSGRLKLLVAFHAGQHAGLRDGYLAVRR